MKTLHKYPITTLCLPPTAFRQLVHTDNNDLFRLHPPSCLEHCVSAGEALEGEMISSWKSITGIEIKDGRQPNYIPFRSDEDAKNIFFVLVGYGQTETSLLCGNFPGQSVKPGSMGLPAPGMPLAVVDENGSECPVGVEGDIALAVRDADGDHIVGIFDGYLREDGTKERPLRLERTLKTGSSPREWYLTGDRASRDGDGYFWFLGRADDIINSAGYRIGDSPISQKSEWQLG